MVPHMTPWLVIVNPDVELLQERILVAANVMVAKTRKEEVFRVPFWCGCVFAARGLVGIGWHATLVKIPQRFGLIVDLH